MHLSITRKHYTLGCVPPAFVVLVVWCHFLPSPMFFRGGVWSRGMGYGSTPSVEQTNMCKNITFKQLRLRAVTITTILKNLYEPACGILSLLARFESSEVIFNWQYCIFWCCRVAADVQSNGPGAGWNHTYVTRPRGTHHQRRTSRHARSSRYHNHSKLP